MVRIPLLKMCSRETERLPTAVIIAKLNADKTLPIELPGLVVKPSEKFFIYHEDPMESSNEVYCHQFKLVEVIGKFQERILLYGDATGITFHTGDFPYISFHGNSEKIGRYGFYCPYFERKRN